MTQVELVNQALVRIGQTKSLLSSMSDPSATARVASAVWDLSRDTVLAAFPWPFAKKTSVLGLLADVERSGWAYAYARPSDCLKVRHLWDGAGDSNLDLRIPFEEQGNDAGDGSIILTDQEEAELVYTGRIQTVNAFPPEFCEALAWKLAGELVLGIRLSAELRVNAERFYRAALSEAQAAAANQQQQGLRSSSFVRIRGGLTSEDT